ncbi:DUF3224 domain-containing protein [Modestobacter sp. VKM Ac-2979]|uniref:DUF3224 domain-containing protein n=1 Tax=unclassified Modestobacter TaxID=2643866 RepID=UPI0022AB5A53|nr:MULTISPECIES: DUF3224 domain-containing protein [unclassified Modestobacter]MCZ2811103.1 DUF3224 domain-containing protein [Modestobacter sp. VKM Ac-2979]MCZ2840616.1 DUF3224 domain-containing protein [Modestobacter sp. VKM Ac-2980]
MDLHLTAPFTIDTWDAVGDPEPAEPGAPATGRVVLAKTYEGEDLTGSATGHALTTQGERGASYVAQERITGALAGRRGSFVLEHGAAMGEGVETTQWARVVAGSGTAALAGLSGTGTVAHELITLDVVLPD